MINRKTLFRAALLATIVITAAWLVQNVMAVSGGDYSLSWWTFDGGGASLSDGSYTLGGTAGQPEAVTLEGSSYRLEGGFWPPNLVKIYLPLVKK
jgi:hypothetical protein